MRFTNKILVISVICILICAPLGFAEPPAEQVPSPSYVPLANEFRPNLAQSVADISQAITAKNKEQLISIADNLTTPEEIGGSRGDEDEKYFLSAYARRNAGDLARAVEDFQKSIEYRQSNPHAHFLLAQTFADLGKCENVFQELDQVKFLLGTQNAASYFLRGQCLAKLNRQSEAAAILTAARKEFPADAQIKKLSLSFKAQAMSQGAILDAQQVAELDGDLAELATANPDDSNIQLMYGRCLLKKGDILTKSAELDQAETIARTQVEKSQYKNEISLKLLFDVLLKKRKNREAQELLAAAQKSLPESKILADCKKQLEIEVTGLKVLKYDRR